MTLVEMLIAMVLGLVVFGVIVGLVSVSFQAQATSDSQAVATQMGTDMMQRITRDIRQATSATIDSAPGTPASSGCFSYAYCGGALTLKTEVPGSGGGPSSLSTVVYNCTSGSCTRQVGSGPTQPLVDQHVAISPSFVNTVFRGSRSNAGYLVVGLDLKLVGPNGKPLTNPFELQDGVALRYDSSP